jgi:hypothetical protein
MAEKLKRQPQKPGDAKRATERKPATGPPPNPPPRDCAEAPAPNPNGDLSKSGTAT